MRTDQLERLAIVEAGGTVLADEHKGCDDQLVAWAKETDHYVYIGDRENHTAHKRSIWYNPFKERVYGRSEAVRLYHDYVLNRPDLLARLPELRGKVLGCWCYPLLCHGTVLIELLGTAGAISFMHYQLILTGKLCSNPEIGQTKKGRLWVKLLLETELVREIRPGELQNETTTVPISFFSGPAEQVRQLKTGEILTVACHIYGTKFDNHDGTTKHGVQLVCDTVFP